jgi:hypothetical protein
MNVITSYGRGSFSRGSMVKALHSEAEAVRGGSWACCRRIRIERERVCLSSNFMAPSVPVGVPVRWENPCRSLSRRNDP